MRAAFLMLSILGVLRCGFAQQWRTPIAVNIPTRFDINLRGIPSRCYKVVRPADGRITAQVVGSGDWNLCVGDQNCPFDCMSGGLRKVSTKPLTSGTHYYVVVERRGGDAMASLLIYPTAGGAPNSPSTIIGTWTAVIPSKNFRRGGYKISQNGSKLSLLSPDGASSSAYYQDDSTIMAEQWKTTGTISGGGKRIDWANGSYWER
jgi:hypothetical protein